MERRRQWSCSTARFAFTCLFLLCGALPGGALGVAPVAAETPRDRISQLPAERPVDPPAPPRKLATSGTAAVPVTFGRFSSIQVNVTASGMNSVGDAANEPSIAVDPNDHNRMAIGWRQFDAISSNFRQAGYGYTTDGGLTWTNGKIQAGTFRSDPILSADAAGNFFYNSLSTPNGVYTSHVFRSTNGGATWGTGAFAFGGDKVWMTIDRTGGTGNDHHYQAWSTAANSYAPNTFNRSIDDGANFQAPVTIPDSPVWGTLDMAADGTLYVVGTDGPGGSTFVSRSTNARDALVTPTFTTVSPNLGGSVQIGGPNPAGLLGQLWIAVDRSAGPHAGNVYVLASVVTAGDPMDVHFIRSTDGGTTWSSPLRLNDDALGNGAWQWFGTMSVAPDGRIEAVWNDSRLSGVSSQTALYYTYSSDGGVTWSANEQASPLWNSLVGFPNQNKIGDYYHMVSDVNGADLAWSATFNGEQDVYYLRIPRVTTSVVDGPGRPARLHPNVPNPFAASTAIAFDVSPGGAHVDLGVFDVRGQRVATLAKGFTEGGSRIERWSGRDSKGREVGPGVYFLHYVSEGRTETRKILRVQ